MYVDPRLLLLTEGVRLRILAATLVGLLAVAAGIARLAVAAVIIVRVILDGASFSTLAWPLVAMAGLVVLRSLLQYSQEMISHHTASLIKVSLRARLYQQALALGPGYFDQARTGDVVTSLADGVERLEVFFGKYLPQLIVAALAPVLIFAFMAFIDLGIAFIFLGFALFTLVAPNLFHRWNRASSSARRQAYGALGADYLDAVQGLGTLKAFGQSRDRGRVLADRARLLYLTTMGVLAANSVTNSITILGISAGAALAFGRGRSEGERGQPGAAAAADRANAGGGGLQAPAGAGAALSRGPDVHGGGRRHLRHPERARGRKGPARIPGPFRWLPPAALNSRRSPRAIQ